MKAATSIKKYVVPITKLACLTMLTAHAFGQRVKPGYQQLKQYEGIYEYINHTTLKIAASPNDSFLYAIINESRYPLRPQAKDDFVNSGNDLVHFLRDKQNKISGYVTGRDTFKLLNKSVSFPKSMWYPRLLEHPETYHYQYKKPTDIKDDLSTGSIAGTGLDASLLSQMMEKIVKGNYPNVRSILIIKNGKLVFEEYFYDYDRNRLQEMRSASKSIISALTGIAIHNHTLPNVNIKLRELLPQYTFANPSPLKDLITLKDLLDNQSGVAYDAADPKLGGDETAMGYSHDWIKYTYDLPMVDTPGKVGRYNSGNPITVGKIIEQHAQVPLHDYAAKYLFGPLNIHDFKWNFKPDESNAENFCQVFLTPRDMAKFGLLYLQNGVWNNKQVVPKSWVEESTTKHSVVQGVNYGYLWWLKHLDTKNKAYQSYAAQGNGGQKIYVFKDLNMVVVTTGGNYNSQSPADEIIKQYILPGFD